MNFCPAFGCKEKFLKETDLINHLKDLHYCQDSYMIEIKDGGYKLKLEIKYKNQIKDMFRAKLPLITRKEQLEALNDKDNII
jgi:hypothetical protein